MKIVFFKGTHLTPLYSNRTIQANFSFYVHNNSYQDQSNMDTNNYLGVYEVPMKDSTQFSQK